MKFEEFSEEIINKFGTANIQIDQKQIEDFYNFMNLLVEWNSKINLTAITKPDEIILKHFLDSVMIVNHIDVKYKVIDVGTGAGFPGIPLKIMQNNNITLVDSLNKRISFLEEVIKKLDLDKVTAIHSRAEDLANNNTYRENYDIAVSRAVAPLNILLEYGLPFVKVGGKFICMKGSNIAELEEAQNALNILGGKIEKIDEFKLGNEDIKRNIIIIRKVKDTLSDFPRKSGKPAKDPIK